MTRIFPLVRPLAAVLALGAIVALAAGARPDARSLRLPQGEFHGVGDVVHSVLPPGLFEEVHEGQWALLAGDRLDAGSGLHRFLEEKGRLDLLQASDTAAATLPDARGVFVRGMNLGRDAATGDPTGDRRVGAYQADLAGPHTHPFSYRRGQPEASRGGGSNHRVTDNLVDDSGQTGNNAGAETRPRNITLYVYVKIGN